MELASRFEGCLIGLAVGDAIGTTVEFSDRGSFPPLTDMIGGGPFNLAAGQWTDDTSMALCLATSLLECRGSGPHDQMTRYVRWLRAGYLSSTGDFVDVGTTVARAIAAFEKTGEPFSGPTHPKTAGNGSIMRLAPVPMYYYPDRQAVWHYSGESSRTTHGAAECIDACRLLGDILYRALLGESKQDILFGNPFQTVNSPRIQEIANGAYSSKPESEVRGTGYVVQSLEAALWCFLHEESFDSTVLRAANLGDDADTTAAIAGQVAGAFYGLDCIRQQWRDQLAFHDEISRLANRLRVETAASS